MGDRGCIKGGETFDGDYNGGNDVYLVTIMKVIMYVGWP